MNLISILKRQTLVGLLFYISGSLLRHEKGWQCAILFSLINFF
ncbi:hypothetical protein HNR53_001587 [Bacillus benzoevorans]|uniref:Uncharacterized protein n=1 Tax=Bacillus benzoevorans TaxID=1456 RepID=A0A7X0HSB8_9BACI|nr:hypothetical protein [Bacillus benzoevorans]